MSGSDYCVYEIRNETLRETFLAIAGDRPEQDWAVLAPEFFPGWTDRDVVRRGVIERGLDWAAAEDVLGGMCRARLAAAWIVRAPAFALEAANPSA